jgi:hypothetical protein
MNRHLQSKFVAILGIAVAFALFMPPAWAESLKNSDSALRPVRDNSGKQIAMAAPKPKGKVSEKTGGGDSMEAAIVSVREQMLGQLKSHNISVAIPEVDIPDNMEKTCDTCYHAVRTSVTFAQEHAAEFGGWFARYIKQLSGPPAMTPCGSPYSYEQKLVPSTFGQHQSKLYLTEHGRLKTVVSR